MSEALSDVRTAYQQGQESVENVALTGAAAIERIIAEHHKQKPKAGSNDDANLVALTHRLKPSNGYAKSRQLEKSYSQVKASPSARAGRASLNCAHLRYRGYHVDARIVPRRLNFPNWHNGDATHFRENGRETPDRRTGR